MELKKVTDAAFRKYGRAVQKMDFTELVEAFLLPKGTAVEVYATTLHYAPCSVDGQKFQVAVVLPKDTNLPLEKEHNGWEDRLLAAKNKWLIGHPEGGLPEDAYIGLTGKNISVK